MTFADYAAFLTTFCVTALGVIGTRIALHGRTGKKARTIWRVSLVLNVLFLVCALAALILSARDHARDAANEHQRTEQSRKAEKERDEQIRSLSENVRKLLTFVSFPQSGPPPSAKQPVANSSSNQELPLKARTEILAGELFRFAQLQGPHMEEGNIVGLNASDLPKTRILGNPPSVSEIDSWAREATQQYKEFMTAYYTEFSGKVVLLCNDLANKGVLDDTLGNLCRDPVSPGGVRALAELMSKAGKKIP